MLRSRLGVAVFFSLFVGFSAIGYLVFFRTHEFSALSSGDFAIKQEAKPHESAQHIEDLVRSNKIERGVVFPESGKAFSVIRQHPRPRGDALNYVNSLLAKSKGGNAAATYAIYMAVNQCKSSLTRPSDAMLQIYRESGAEDAYLAELSRNLDECGPLTANTELMSQPWLEKAAKQGSIEASLMYSIDVDSVVGPPSEYLSHPEKLTEYRRDAMGYLNAVANAGSVDALMLLGRAYDTGILTDKSSMKAFAYYKSVEDVSPSSQIHEMVNTYRKNLSADEANQASQLSSVILRSCCQ